VTAIRKPRGVKHHTSCFAQVIERKGIVWLGKRGGLTQRLGRLRDEPLYCLFWFDMDDKPDQMKLPSYATRRRTISLMARPFLSAMAISRHSF
jgi:hypothetical protein